MSTKKSSKYSGVTHVAQSILIVLVVLGLLGPTTALAHFPGVTEWISVSSDGTGANNQSDMPAISGDGRFIAFVSLADNLVPEDTNGFADTFVHDRLTNSTERVSVSNRGRQGNEHSGLIGVAAYPAISADGRFVAFESQAQNLVSGGNPFLFVDQVYVHDRETGTTEIISVNDAGEAGNSLNVQADISADGRFVGFSSFADNLVPGLQSGLQVYLRDRLTGTIE